MGHFVPSPKESEKRDRRDYRGDEREGQGRKRNRNEKEETAWQMFHMKCQALLSLKNIKVSQNVVWCSCDYHIKD